MPVDGGRSVEFRSPEKWVLASRTFWRQWDECAGAGAVQVPKLLVSLCHPILLEGCGDVLALPFDVGVLIGSARLPDGVGQRLNPLSELVRVRSVPRREE